MKLLSFIVMLALLAIVMLAASSPPTEKTKQNVIASTSYVQPVAQTEAQGVTALVSNNKKMISFANSDNEVVGTQPLMRENEVAARARNGTLNRRDSRNFNQSNMRVETDIGNILLL